MPRERSMTSQERGVRRSEVRGGVSNTWTARRCPGEAGLDPELGTAPHTPAALEPRELPGPPLSPTPHRREETLRAPPLEAGPISPAAPAAGVLGFEGHWFPGPRLHQGGAPHQASSPPTPVPPHGPLGN